jgi:DNA primase
MPGVNFQLVRERITMQAVLRQLPFEATVQRGDQCHSFSVNVRLGRYHCFVCGSHGHALELWSAVRGVNLHAAAVELCQLLGVEVPWVRRW